MHFLLQFYVNSFETLQVFRSWSEDVHIVWAYSPQNFYCHFLHKFNELSHFCDQIKILGILCMHLLLQFNVDTFETLQVFRSWSEDVHIIWA